MNEQHEILQRRARNYASATWEMPLALLLRELAYNLDALEAELAEARGRLEIADVRISSLTKMLRYIAFVLTGDEAAEAELAADRAKTALTAAEDEKARLTADAAKFRAVVQYAASVTDPDSSAVWRAIRNAEHAGDPR